MYGVYNSAMAEKNRVTSQRTQQRPQKLPQLIWEKEEPRRRDAPAALSRDLIVRAATTLADRDGLAGLSLRNVGAALGAGPMRLYAYISSKDELLDLMVDAVYAEMLAEGPFPKEWRQAMRVNAGRLRRTAQRHAWFGDMLGGRPHQGPKALACLEMTLAVLDRSGRFASIDDTLQALRTLQAYITGAIQSESRERFAERESGLNKAEWQLATGSHLAALIGTGRFPTIAKVVDDALHPDADRVFEDGLACVLDGIEARCLPVRGPATAKPKKSSRRKD